MNHTTPASSAAAVATVLTHAGNSEAAAVISVLESMHGCSKIFQIVARNHQVQVYQENYSLLRCSATVSYSCGVTTTVNSRQGRN